MISTYLRHKTWRETSLYVTVMIVVAFALHY